MSGIIDHRPYNYSHGIVSKDCFAKEYSDIGGIAIKLVCTGTFVQVHSIRDDDVLFCIVRDDMEVEMNQMVCKKADIINVPENLWGPLFTVKKMARLSLVKDTKVAESIGNISVGHTVQVLGPDGSVICLANVTFRNSIGRLGVGVYFGLQVLSPKENLQTIIEKVSLLGPGTKGFPRGCDIVVTVDKILPNDQSFSKEKSISYYDKDCKKQQGKGFFTAEDVNAGSFKSAFGSNLKDKQSSRDKRDDREAAPDPETDPNHFRPSKTINSDNPLHVGDEVIYLHGEVPEKGLVKWIGLIENSLKAEVEFEHPIGGAAGAADGGFREFLATKHQNALIVSPTALIKLSDYMMNTSKEKFHLKKNSNFNNNNKINNIYHSNNNNYYANNLYTNSNIKPSNNNNCNNNNNNNNSNKNNNINSDGVCGSSSSSSSSSNGSGSCGGGGGSNNNINNNDDCCRSYESFYDGKQGVEDNYKRSKNVPAFYQCLKEAETNDCFPAPSKEEAFGGKDLHKGGHKSDGTFEFGFQSISERPDFPEPGEIKLSCKRSCGPADNGLAPKETNSCAATQNPGRAPRPNRSSHDFFDLPGPERDRSHRGHFCAVKKLSRAHGGDDDFGFGESSGAHSAEKNPRTPHEKVTVLEQSFLAKSNGEAARSGGGGGGDDGVYDVPRSAVREASASEGRAPRLRPSGSPRAWGPRCSEHSSSDENLAERHGPSGGVRPSASFHEDLGKGSVVELSFKGEPHFGVIRWIGTLQDEREDRSPRLIAGIEMEEEYPGFTDGTFNSKRYFQCNPKKALFVPLSECRKDSRFLEESQKQSASPQINYGQIDCPAVEGTVPPISRKGDIESICGKNRGIQGHHNSCYLDATLFSMFAFTSVFDSLLYRPPNANDIPQYGEVQRVLREEIVNPLRKNLYVRADRVMKLRTLLEKLSSVSGLTSEEKDPEEFLNSLLAQILKAEPFLKLSSGQEAFHYQLFVEKDERLVLPSVQQLFEQSFLASDIKLKQVPSCLIIQMPRFGKSFKMYSRILPPHLLDVTDIIENSPRQCTVCGKLAEYECKDCFGQQGIGNGLESISFCKTCLDTVHNHHCRSRHNSRALTVPVEFYELQEHCIIPRLYMELFAVVCIETSHYVAFVKCGSGPDAPWCFFDSMADRKGEQNGYNIPEMVPCPDLPFWLSEDGAKMLNEMRDERQLTEHAKRLFSDAYMCMYQSPDLMMYR